MRKNYLKVCTLSKIVDTSNILFFPGTPITYSGDPLKDFSLIRFLDRFVFKNPKKINGADGSHPTFGIRKKYKPSGLRSLALNSDKYLKINEENIPVEEIFLYK